MMASSVYPDMKSTFIPGRSGDSRSQSCLPPSRGITTSVRSKWIAPLYCSQISKASPPVGASVT